MVNKIQQILDIIEKITNILGFILTVIALRKVKHKKKKRRSSKKKRRK